MCKPEQSNAFETSETERFTLRVRPEFSFSLQRTRYVCYVYDTFEHRSVRSFQGTDAKRFALDMIERLNERDGAGA